MRSARISWLIGGVWFVIGAPGIVWSDELSTLREQVERLQQEYQEHQQETQALRQRLDQQHQQIEQLTQHLQALQGAGQPPLGEASASVPQAAAASLPKESSDLGPGIPKLVVRGFTDVTFSVEDDRNAPDRSNTFALGQHDLFITSELSDRVDFLSETVFEAGDDNETGLDLERLVLKYDFNDLLNVKIGRMHTPLGYWNTAYHHGTWLQTTAFRPLMLRFEDDGGILPVHQVGLEVEGHLELSPVDLKYHAGISNGRASSITTVQNVQDGNDAKALNAMVSFSPHAVPGLTFGVMSYLDRIPPNLTTSARAGEINELILGGYATYLYGNVELLGEFWHLRHQDQVSDNVFGTPAFYLQAAYRWEKWKPYYRFESIDYGAGDPFFQSTAVDVTAHTIGLRWDPLTWNAIKFEYGYQGQEGRADIQQVTLQSAFTF